MSAAVIVIHIAFAVLFFFVLNWIGEHSSKYGYIQLTLFVTEDRAPAFNFILKALAPSVYIILLAVTLYKLDLDKFVVGIWLVTVYYFCFRLGVNLLFGRARLLNWPPIVFQFGAGIGVAYLCYVHFILPKEPLFPDAREIGNQIWIIIALFIYATLNAVRVSDEASVRRKNSYIRARFTDFRRAYGALIEGQMDERFQELVVYAVLVHENFNRPWFVRCVERLVFPWGSRTLGPMQVHTSKRISDEESVRQGVQKLKQAFETTAAETVGKRLYRYQVISIALAKYNRDATYIGEITSLLHILWAQVAPEYRLEFETMYTQHPI